MDWSLLAILVVGIGVFLIVVNGAAKHRSRNDGWEKIGSTGPFQGGGDVTNVPAWVLAAYDSVNVHHHGLIYHFNGRHFRYRIVESGQGGGYATIYRKKR